MCLYYVMNSDQNIANNPNEKREIKTRQGGSDIVWAQQYQAQKNKDVEGGNSIVF